MGQAPMSSPASPTLNPLRLKAAKSSQTNLGKYFWQDEGLENTWRRNVIQTIINPSNAGATFVQHKDLKIYENYLNTVILVFIG